MTKRERELLKQAVNYIHDDEPPRGNGDYQLGMDILMRLLRETKKNNGKRENRREAD